MFRCSFTLVACAVAVMVMETGAQNTYYYRPSSSLSSRYKTSVPAVDKKSIHSINSIDDFDDFDSFKPDYNTFIKPYNPFGSWARPAAAAAAAAAAVQQTNKPAATQQYKWKYDSIESDESDEYYYRRPSTTRQAKPMAKKPVTYYHSDSSESDEIYYRRPASSKPISIAKKATTYYHSDESDEDIYRRFLASYRQF